MIHRIGLAALVGSLVTVPAAAQFSSDIPGVPRGAISLRGGHQNRTEWEFTGYKVPTGTAGSDSLGGGLRVGFGTSYRMFGSFELGYDFTLFDAYAVQPPTIKPTLANPNPQSPLYLRGMAAYGIKIGGKYRPIVALDPDGNGYEIAFGAAMQPQLKPLYGAEHLGDSLRQGGQFYKPKDNAPPSTFFKTDPFTKLSTTTQFAAMGSYRTRRLIGDAAIVMEKVGTRTAIDGSSPLTEYDGVSIRAGGAYRLTPSIAVGGAFWGTGAPPWRDEVRYAPGTAKTNQYSALIQFGSTPEGGIDLMYTTPTGNWAQSGRLYIRARSTR